MALTNKQRAKGTENRNKKLTAKQKTFAKRYVETKKATQAVLDAGYNVKNKGVASALATENLAKPKIRQEIARLMQDNDIEMAEVLAIHKRNLLQDKHLPTSQKAVNDYYELVGLKQQDDTNKVQIAFIVEK